jgi:hypothetical protein
MTVINGIDIDNYRHINNDTKKSIINNEPIDDNLHVILVLSNPCLYARRYLLAREFIYRMEQENNVILYVVELCYTDQKHMLIDNKNPRHLAIYTDTAPLWHKENMINIGVNKLLPKLWKAFAWIDADIEFENPYWALDTLKILNGHKDIVQLFSHCLDMDKKENIMNIFSSFGFHYDKKQKYSSCSGPNFWHPGYAWAINRNAYEKIDGLFEYSILGSGDNNMALSLLGYGLNSINGKSSDGYKNAIKEFQIKALNLRLGYVPGVIRHYFHGSKINRKYSERWQILVKHQYDPNKHIVKLKNGLLVPSELCPQELLDDIYNYFKERNEDE